MTMTSDGHYLTGLWFDDQEGPDFELSAKSPDRLTAGTPARPELTAFAAATRWLDLYFDGKNPDFTPPLKLEGTTFRRRVWEILLTIPYGQTMSYGEIAGIISAENSSRPCARAVGGAAGHNPVHIIVPCHRVVGADGSLTGYAGGIDRKIRLLALERISLS